VTIITLITSKTKITAITIITILNINMMINISIINTIMPTAIFETGLGDYCKQTMKLLSTPSKNFGWLVQTLLIKLLFCS
jgi:hypothetical protein